jgi:carbon monoxide dehydrogenase subunit G
VKVTGTATLHAPREQVWAALNDPAVLVLTIPGCQQMEEVGPDRYRMTLTAGVASIKGSYQGDVALTDQEQPGAFTLKASGAGAPGTVSADVRVTLSDAGAGTTRLDYDADAVVGGMIGGVGQRVLTGVAKKTAGEFFHAVDDVLTGKAPSVPAPREEPTGPLGAPATPGVFTAQAAATAGTGLSSDFVKGAVFGAVVALLGALVGALGARRRG